LPCLGATVEQNFRGFCAGSSVGSGDALRLTKEPAAALGIVLVFRPRLLQNLYATVALLGAAILSTGVVLIIKQNPASDKP
jgi:hypothetical protein